MLTPHHSLNTSHTFELLSHFSYFYLCSTFIFVLFSIYPYFHFRPTFTFVPLSNLSFFTFVLLSPFIYFFFCPTYISLSSLLIYFLHERVTSFRSHTGRKGNMAYNIKLLPLINWLQIENQICVGESFA